MSPLLFGIGAAIGWGIADYSAALASRRIGALWTSLGMQVVGTAAFAVALLALGQWQAITAEAVPWAMVLTLLGGGSLYLLYRGMALGPIAVVSPVVASYAAITVVLVVFFLGERLTILQTAAVATTFAGVVLSTTDLRAFLESIRRPLPGIRISLVATFGFAAWGTLLAAA
ncbi:MAG: EamA family transporter, partial [Chloroflexota bacterium]